MPPESARPVVTPYDQIPYQGRPCSESHPSRLGAIATLLGMVPPPVATARVLELACGDGANLLAIAESLPQARCVGIDLSARHIAQAQTLQRSLGLTNVEFRQGDIMHLGPDLGEFDYIVAHGLYSWVPRPVQDRLLALCKRLLHPNGVAFVSYNLFPGWRIQSILRDFMVFHTRDLGTPQQWIAGAREALDILIAMGTHAQMESAQFVGNYARVFKRHIDSLGPAGDSLLLYDSLASVNTPTYFAKFTEHAAQFKLQFLAEADFRLSLPESLPEPVLQLLGSSIGSQVDLEQYVDFFKMRMFRHSLLVHAERELPDSLDVAQVMRLYVASSAHAKGVVDPKSAEAVDFTTDNEQTLSTNHRLTKAAMLQLYQQWPQAVAFPDLVAAARLRLQEGNPPSAATESAALSSDVVTLGMNLVRAFSHGADLLALHAVAPAVANTIPERPRTSGFARVQAKTSREVTTLFHQNALLPRVTALLVPMLDGQRTQAELVAGLHKLVETAQVEILELAEFVDAEVDEDSLQLDALLRASVKKSLEILLNAALLYQ